MAHLSRLQTDGIGTEAAELLVASPKPSPSISNPVGLLSGDHISCGELDHFETWNLSLRCSELPYRVLTTMPYQDSDDEHLAYGDYHGHEGSVEGERGLLGDVFGRLNLNVRACTGLE